MKCWAELLSDSANNGQRRETSGVRIAACLKSASGPVAVRTDGFGSARSARGSGRRLNLRGRESMGKNKGTVMRTKCSFCHQQKTNLPGERIVLGAAAAICEDCVDLFRRMLAPTNSEQDENCCSASSPIVVTEKQFPTAPSTWPASWLCSDWVFYKDGKPVSSCDEPVNHADHFHNAPLRGWCDRHTPWSGHFNDCPDPCRDLVRENGGIWIDPKKDTGKETP